MEPFKWRIDGASRQSHPSSRGDRISILQRYHVWKEPLAVRNRTMSKGLAHKQIVEDSCLCDVASADYLLMFRKKGRNPIPIAHPTGLQEYAGERQIPPELLKYKNWKETNRESILSLDLAPVRFCVLGRCPDRKGSSLSRGSGFPRGKTLPPFTIRCHR